MSRRKKTVTVKRPESTPEATETLAAAKRFADELNARKKTYRIRIPKLSAEVVTTHSPKVYLKQYKNEGAYIVEVIDKHNEDERE